jgi:hypothetical protein
MAPFRPELGKWTNKKTPKGSRRDRLRFFISSRTTRIIISVKHADGSLKTSPIFLSLLSDKKSWNQGEKNR